MILIILGLFLVSALEDRSYTQKQFWFDQQLVDHSDPTLRDLVWSQRYWAVQDYFDIERGTIILYICGEYTCPGVNPDRLFVIDLAKRYKALILVLEHRFYGLSLPFGNESLTLKNLQYLNVHQALDDLAYFLNWVKSNQILGVTERNPWISVGGSYPGAMSAWFRYKYPHLSVGALASSAVVNTIVDYPEFDGQIYTSTLKSGIQCTQALQQLRTLAEQYLADQTKSLKFKQSFKSENLNDGEFLFMFADVFVEMVQYGKRTQLCDQLTNKTLDQQMDWTVDYVQREVDITSYGSYYLKNQTFDLANGGSRQWTYQTCTEVGWLQTAPQNLNKSMRSQQLNTSFYKQWCQDAFGTNLWPNTNITNVYFGGAKLNVPGLIMTNGNEDPWKHASVLFNRDGQLFQAIEIICDNCAHCVELYTPTEGDSDNLKVARQIITDSFDEWISRYWYQLHDQENVVE